MVCEQKVRLAAWAQTATMGSLVLLKSPRSSFENRRGAPGGHRVVAGEPSCTCGHGFEVSHRVVALSSSRAASLERMRGLARSGGNPSHPTLPNSPAAASSRGSSSAGQLGLQPPRRSPPLRSPRGFVHPALDLRAKHRAVLPNPSVKAIRYGWQRKPGVRRLRHLRTPGLHCQPPLSPYLER